MSVDAVTKLFTRSDGAYHFARWGRPIAPIVFGVQDETLSVVKSAFEAVTGMVGHPMAETDPELGSNLMMFFFRDWSELLEVPDLGQMIDGLEGMVARLSAAKATQYRVFRFDDDGAIKACFVFVRMDKSLADLPADALVLSQVIQAFVLWSDAAFADRSVLGALPDGRLVLRPDIVNVVRAAYDPVMPAVAHDASHAMRLAARLPAGA
ncbi:hypothetical protein [Pseudoprimorskyibacter insulae]|uniref:Uncharacterized protein n=1 Tax=Pseudoprimorskyibacter insulae TaxID=1695997 RepID=A0A2R8AVN5_9RHOB|nr:hypothetical protein [Pseudoprimorskyibacter insulae]SPF79974.1 hypothetical protein PRI8871_01776 [Pseudoprimorskyibacter insulae]